MTDSEIDTHVATLVAIRNHEERNLFLLALADELHSESGAAWLRFLATRAEGIYPEVFDGGRCDWNSEAFDDGALGDYDQLTKRTCLSAKIIDALPHELRQKGLTPRHYRVYWNIESAWRSLLETLDQFAGEPPATFSQPD